MCDQTLSSVRCRECGETIHPEDTGSCRCYMRQTQTKTITLPLDVAERFEDGDETSADMDLLREKLTQAYEDMVF